MFSLKLIYIQVHPIADMENRLKFEDNQDYDALQKYDSRINDLSSFINKTKNKLSYKLPKEERKDLEKILENQQNRFLGFISDHNLLTL